MGKNIIITVSIREYSQLKGCIKSMMDYSKRIGVDFYNLRFPVINFHSVYFEKFIFVDLLDKYDRVLFLDADIMITPNAKNIFDYYPDDNVFYAYNETSDNELMDRDFCVEPLLGDCPHWPKDGNNKYRYFNSGVMLISKKHKNFFKDFRNVPNIPGVINKFPDQTYLNYMVVKNNIPFGYMDYSFNRMHLGVKDDNNERYKSDFIHYAGSAFVYGDGDKLITIQKDYMNLYNEVP